MRAGRTFTPVSITGAGVVSCAGNDLESFWKNAVEDRSGISSDGLGRVHAPGADGVGESRPIQLAVIALRQAMEQAGWGALDERDGLIVATTVGQIPLWEDELTRFLKGEIGDEAFSRALALQPLGSVTEALSRVLNFGGKSLVVASACSAATQAIGLASLWVAQGRVRRCLVGATEVLSRLTVEGFRSLKLLSQAPCRPFDENRQGINLSEGAAFFCIEAESPRSLARVSGAGFSTDAYHMAAPHPEGRGSFQAMEAALHGAGLSSADIDWVHAHGTGSRANDVSEGAAIAQLFGPTRPYVSSTKAIHGHALGASGAIETALCVQALRKQRILKTAGLERPDPAIAISHPIENVSIELRHILKNTLGFGGNNAALVLSAPGANSEYA